jgi:acetyl/propionyl-CoA carboxylase alpha subunit
VTNGGTIAVVDATEMENVLRTKRHAFVSKICAK